MPDRTRILIIAPSHPDLAGDEATRAAHALFRAARAGGLEATFLSGCRPQADQALFKPGAVITGLDQRPDEYLFLADSLEPAWWRNLNLRALTCFADFLREMRPQVVHFHHFANLGLDLLLVARRTLPEARLVFTLHDFLGICRAQGLMQRTGDGTLCDRASPLRCHQCFREVPPEHVLLREDWVKHAFSAMDAFIAPTGFVRRRYVAWGLAAEKIHVLDQAAETTPDDPDRPLLPVTPRSGPPDRFGVFGDASGLGVLGEALGILDASGGPRVVLDIHGAAATGTGPARPAAPTRHLVQHRGAWTMADLPGRMAGLDWVVVPSTGWDPAAPGISLARGFGKPPVGSAIGGIAGRVRHDQDGLLFAVGDAVALAAVLRRCVTEAGLHARLVAGAPPAATRDAILAAHLAVYAAPPAAPNAR